MYLTAIQSPPRFQWESSSGTAWASQSNNCGPTCVTKIAQFYLDRWFGIEATRKLVAACCIPTSAPMQRDMLIKRGVPATVISIDSIAQLRQLVSGGTRPIIVGVLMSRVPSSVRGHPFLGWHAIAILGTAYVGMPGFWVDDPNFSVPGGIRPDPQQGRRFYSEATLKHAFIDNSPRWSVVPLAHKQTSLPDTALPEVHPMLKAKAQPWAAHAGGASVYETPNGKFIRKIPGGTELTTIGETLDGKWRQVLAEVGGENRWVYARRVDLVQLVPPPATRTPTGDPAFDKAITNHLLSRVA
jgi:hypothetical protein